MRAIVLEQHGGPEQLIVRELPRPEPRDDDVVIRVQAFGLNRAETYMRQGAWGNVARVIGIECVGVVESGPDGHFQPGQKVAALMGGMGRTINGSYAEYTRVPATNVVPLNTDLPWEALAVIPESYATAWSCLYRNLQLQVGQVLLIRGATSALGQAALNIAAHAGATVLASTRDLEKTALLERLGATHVLQEGPDLSAKVRESYAQGIDAVLDIVGNQTLLDSLAAVRRSGRVCLAGFLAGTEPIASFDPLSQMPSGVHLSFFASFMFGTPEFPLSDVPLQQMVDHVASGAYQARPAKVFDFNDIQQAHRLMESNRANGKIVVRHRP